MMKIEDAQALATSTNLFIREQKVTASVAKVLCGKIKACNKPGQDADVLRVV